MTDAERIAELEAWARNRIEECQRQEVKFGRVPAGRLSQPPQSLIEAWTERRTLEAVLAMLGRTEFWGSLLPDERGRGEP